MDFKFARTKRIKDDLYSCDRGTNITLLHSDLWSFFAGSSCAAFFNNLISSCIALSSAVNRVNSLHNMVNISPVPLSIKVVKY